MTDNEAIIWLKVHIGKPMGYALADRDDVYMLAINALLERQEMKEEAKE